MVPSFNSGERLPQPAVFTGRFASAAVVLFALLTVRPACAQYRIFWGDVHGHTSHSDGKGSLDDYFRYARDTSKLDFVIVTDHDFGNGPPWRMSQAVWAETQAKADAYTVGGRFIAIAGYEWTSQPKYWTEVEDGSPSERLFAGRPKFYNHKNVYFPGQAPSLFSAKDGAFMTPDLLAAAVLKQGGLIHNNHPSLGRDGADQWAYDPVSSTVIANTEMNADTVTYSGKAYDISVEQTVRAYLNRGGVTGFVGGSDTHEGNPVAKTAVLAKKLTREALFDALRQRHNYAITHARIVLRFAINGHEMGEAFTLSGKPKIDVAIQGTDLIKELMIVRDGTPLLVRNPGVSHVTFSCEDETFSGKSYYYLRVTQVDKDPQGNPSRAWSSPIWVSSSSSGVHDRTKRP